MASHSSVLAWRIPGKGRLVVYGVTQSRTRLKRLSSSSKKRQVGRKSIPGWPGPSRPNTDAASKHSMRAQPPGAQATLSDPVASWRSRLRDTCSILPPPGGDEETWATACGAGADGNSDTCRFWFVRPRKPRSLPSTFTFISCFIEEPENKRTPCLADHGPCSRSPPSLTSLPRAAPQIPFFPGFLFFSDSCS